MLRCPKCKREFPLLPPLLLAANETVTVTCPACGAQWLVTLLFVRLEE